MPTIGFQPKQWDTLQETKSGQASWIGLGGGRGAAKSAGLDRVALKLMMDEPGVVCALVMRTAAQVRKYHIEPILRTWPELNDYYAIQKGKLKIPVKLPVGYTFSEMDIGYAENYAAVENFFRSGNYKYVLVDQAEQFTESELREMKKACRWPGGGAKMLLSFNMGGIGIGFLRKIFHLKEYNDRENKDNYKFIKINPWDNCFWVMDALRSDGLTEADYYSWTDEQRMQYAAVRGEYTGQLNSEDDAIRARDWYGSWDSLEGAYFSKVFHEKAIATPFQIGALIKPWWKRWMSGDWGCGHFTSYYWHARGLVEPAELRDVLGIESKRPLSVVLTYREWLGQDMAEQEVGQTLIGLSDDQERGKMPYSAVLGMPERVKALYFSPDAFELSIRRSGQNAIADEIGKVLQAGGLPYPSKANNARVPGWRAMYGLLFGTKKAFGLIPEQDKLPPAIANLVGDTIWLISDACPELLKAIPLLMRDKKNAEDVYKADAQQVDIGQDAADGARYGILCREVTDNSVPQEAKNAALLAKCPTPQDKYMYSMMLPKTGPDKTFRW